MFWDCNMQRPTPKCPVGTTYIPSGKGLCVDTAPVSNILYEAFLWLRKLAPFARIRPFSMVEMRKKYGSDDKLFAPAIDVSYNGAKEYCAFFGMSLLYYNEWQEAFTGGLISFRKNSKVRTTYEYIESGNPSSPAGKIAGRKHLSPRGWSFSYGARGSKRYYNNEAIFRCGVEPK